MAGVNVKIFPEEKDTMVKVIKKNKGKTISVAKLADQAGFNPNRTRFIIAELLEEGRIIKTPTKAFNERYIRYSYDVAK
jgi:predicted transcriptional regulator